MTSPPRPSALLGIANTADPHTHDRIVQRLRREFPTVSEREIELSVERAYRSFDASKIQLYVPILVERLSRDALHELAATHVPTPQC